MRLKKKDLRVTRLASLAGVPDTMPEQLRDELIVATYDAVRLALKQRDTIKVREDAKEKGKPADEIAKLDAEIADIKKQRETALARFKELNARDHASLGGKAIGGAR